MELNGVEIDDTFAEAFPIKVARFLVTGATMRWAKVAATEATGFGTSVIMAPAEAGIETEVSPNETPDGRPGVYAQICNFGWDPLEDQLLRRIGQCVLTAPTARVFNGLPDAEKQLDTGFKLKFFADGWEREEEFGGHSGWAVPMMQGEFFIENNIGATDGIAGGNFFILADNQMAALTAAEAAVDSIMEVEGTITPFPGGIVASGSKPGADKYEFMQATTNQRYCPTLKDEVEGSIIPEDVNAVYELVINGTSEDAIAEATRVGIESAVTIPGVKKITAGNYGGDLGEYEFHLHDLF